MSSGLLCWARLTMTAVISFDISWSESSKRVLSYGIPVSRKISMAPGPEPVTPGMKGFVDHSSARLNGLVAGYIAIPFLIWRSWASFTICWLIFERFVSCRSPISPIIANEARSWFCGEIAFAKR